MTEAEADDDDGGDIEHPLAEDPALLRTSLIMHFQELS